MVFYVPILEAKKETNLGTILGNENNPKIDPIKYPL
jgi:hypothetical protein